MLMLEVVWNSSCPLLRPTTTTTTTTTGGGPTRGGSLFPFPPTSRGLWLLPGGGGAGGVEFVVVQCRSAGGHLREVSGARDARAKVPRGGEVVAADDEGEALAHLEEGLWGAWGYKYATQVDSKLTLVKRDPNSCN